LFSDFPSASSIRNSCIHKQRKSQQFVQGTHKNVCKLRKTHFCWKIIIIISSTACRRECVQKKGEGCRGVNFTETASLLVMGASYDVNGKANAETMFSELAGGDAISDQELYSKIFAEIFFSKKPRENFPTEI
jgi:hypothetical protein